MNYQKHYNLLCERGQNRTLSGYMEKHHIVPRCMGGGDNKENLVPLTPEEHYVAHQLLVRMYPSNYKLKSAVYLMTCDRPNNKVYGWVRREHQKVSKQRTGAKNGSYGKFWYHNPETEEKIKCHPDNVPDGFIKGGGITEFRTCPTCGYIFRENKRNKRQFCSENCRYASKNQKHQKRKNDGKIKAEYYWDLFCTSDYSSLSEFVKDSDYSSSNVSLRNMWEKYIPAFSEISGQGKPLSSVMAREYYTK